VSKEKEFKKICESWEDWVNEQAARRAGDVVDPDDPTSGYMRTKSGDVQKIASMPRPDDEIAKTTSDPEAPGEKALIKRQQKLGKKYRDPAKYEKEAQSLLASIQQEAGSIENWAENWNRSVASSFTFKIPGYKGAENYGFGSLALDVFVLAAGGKIIAGIAGTQKFKNALSATKKFINTKKTSSKGRALVLAAAIKSPKTVSVAATILAAKGTQVLAKGLAKGAVIGKQHVTGEALKAPFNWAKSFFEKGQKITVPANKEAIIAMIQLAKKRGQLDSLMQDKQFVAAARSSGAIGRKPKT